MEIENIQQSLHFAEEIIEEILSRLPVKSLLRFKLISKSWRSLIGNKHFIKKHLQNSTTNPNFSHHRVLFRRCYLENILSQHPVFDNSDTENLKLEIPFDMMYLVGCCNGLLCLILEQEECHQFILWNPSNRISKKLPFMDDETRKGYYTCYGLGWDESSGDYKVVATAKDFRKPKCCVYSLKNDSWKQVNGCNSWKKAIGYRTKKFAQMGILASGSLHWESCDEGEIVCFDLKREVFEEHMSPGCREGCSGAHIGAIGEWLAAYHWCESLSCMDSKGCIVIWVMKEYGVQNSWEKVMDIDILCRPLYISRVLAPFWVGGFLMIKVGNMMIFDGKEFRDLIPLYFGLDVYVESLVSPLEAEEEREAALGNGLYDLEGKFAAVRIG